MSKHKITDFKAICSRLLIGEAQIYFQKLKEAAKQEVIAFPIIFGSEQENTCKDGVFKSESVIIVQLDGYQEWHEATMQEINNRLSISSEKPLAAEDFANMTLEQIMAIATRNKTVSRARKPREAEGEGAEKKDKKPQKKESAQPKTEQDDEGEKIEDENATLSPEQNSLVQEGEVQNA